MNIVKWRPNRELVAVQDEIDRIFGDFFDGMGDDDSMPDPPADLVENDNSFVVSVELPGMKKDEVKLTLKGESLTISGSKREGSESKDNRFHRIERSYGSFCRTIDLPSKVDAAKITARFENGVLVITMPKVEEAKPKEIVIKG